MLTQEVGIKKWVVSQEWHDVLFIHYEVPSDFLQELTPFPLDLYQGKAIVSVVPFQMKGIRFPCLPSVPGLSSLWELNLRTYVKVGNKRGVYFFTLDTDSLLGEFVAQKFFHLPYHYSQINAKVTTHTYEFAHRRDGLLLNIKAEIGHRKTSSEFDLWATERYSLFTQDHEFSYEGRVHHSPWELREVLNLKLNDRFTQMLGIDELGTPKSVSYSKELKVWFNKFEKIGRVRDVN